MVDIAGYGKDSQVNNGNFSTGTVGVLQYLERQHIRGLSQGNNWKASQTGRVYAATEEIIMDVPEKGIRGGDSGGPAFLAGVGNSMEYLAGVASYTSGKAESGKMIGAHVSLSENNIHAWINSVLAVPTSRHVRHESFDSKNYATDFMSSPSEGQETSGATSACNTSLTILLTVACIPLLRFVARRN